MRFSRKARRQAKARSVRYEFFLIQANGSQLRELGALYDKGELRPVIDRTFPFDRTLDAMAHVEQGRTKAGKVVVSIVPEDGAMRVALSLVRFAAVLVGDDRYREQWEADVVGARELDMPPLSVMFGLCALSVGLPGT